MLHGKLVLGMLLIVSFVGNSSLICAISLEKVFIVSKVNLQTVADISAKNIEKEDECFLYLVVKAKEGNKSIYFSDAEKIKVGDREICTRKSDEFVGEFEINWFKVEPEMYHLNGRGHDPANPDFMWYTNAGAPEGSTDRQPLSPDKIKYRENVLPAEQNKWLIRADGCPTDPEYDIHNGCGTMRYKVSIKYKDDNSVSKTLESPGASRYINNGIGNDVVRIVVQQDNSYVGCLSGYFNVPGVFGSYATQVDNYVGVDCADFVVAGWNKYKKRKITYTNVSGLRYTLVSSGLMRLVVNDYYFDSAGNTYARYNINSGELLDKKTIKIDRSNLRPGDVIVFNYNPDKADRSWDHVGILFADSSGSGTPNGILDSYDLILHCGPAEPRINTFNYEGFVSLGQPTRFAILRWIE